MKITKKNLKQLIKEELEEMKQAEYLKTQIDVAKQPQSGLDDAERQILSDIETKLKDLARKGNLNTGALKMGLERLMKIIDAETR